MHSVVRYVSLLARVLDQHLEEVQAGLIVAQGLFGGLGVEHELAVILGVELHAEAERLILTLDRSMISTPSIVAVLTTVRFVPSTPRTAWWCQEETFFSSVEPTIL